MLLHLGSDFVIHTKQIVGIFDLDQTTIGEKTRLLLQKAEQDGILIDASEDLPKSFLIVTVYGETRIYLSSLSSSTLKKRMEEPLGCTKKKT